MEAISYLIGPLGMIKSVNLNWATYSPGIKDKKQQAVREKLMEREGEEGVKMVRMGGGEGGEGEEGQLHILICREE